MCRKTEMSSGEDEDSNIRSLGTLSDLLKSEVSLVISFKNPKRLGKNSFMITNIIQKEQLATRVEKCSRDELEKI